MAQQVEVTVLSRAAEALGARVEFDGREWAIADGAGACRDLIATSELEALLDLRIVRWQYALLWHQGAVVPIERYTTTRTVAGSAVRGCVVPELFWALYREGATAHLRAVHHWHAGCRAVAGALAGATGTSVEAVAFLTPPGASGLRLHRDGATLMVVQAEGHKQWQLEAHPSPGPVTPGRVSEPFPATTTRTLAPGDLLVMGSAVAHRARAEQECSLHVTFGFQQDEGSLGAQAGVPNRHGEPAVENV